MFCMFFGSLVPVDFVIEWCCAWRQARGSCHKAAKPWPSIPCTLDEKKLLVLEVFTSCKLWVKDRKRYHALLKKAGKVGVGKVDNDKFADGLFVFLSLQVIKIQAWRKGGNLQVVCLVLSIKQQDATRSTSHGDP